MAALLFISILLGTVSTAQALDQIRLRLPESVLGWAKAEEDALYDDRSIFDYINGAAEVYRSYNMQRCLSRRFEVQDGPAIILDIFDMGSSEDAYGVFTHDQEGKAMDLGQGAFYRAGWLSMWKDRFFISLYAEEETKETVAALMKLAQSVSRLIEREGDKPHILSYLPSIGIQPGSVKFFHDHMVLNRHYYLAGENILALGPRTNGALAAYRRTEGSARLLLLEYPEQAEAQSAQTSFLKHYIPEADPSGMALLENGTWCGLKRHGRWLIIVLESTDRALARELLEEAAARLQ